MYRISKHPTGVGVRRRTILKAAAASISLAAIPLAHAQKSTAPLTIVFPYGAGGAVDALIRTLGQYLTSELGRPVIVDNRPGANSIIGADHVARSRPDGNTILWAAWPTLTTNLTLFPNLPYSLDNFEPITSTFQGYTSLSVANNIPARNYKEVVEYARANGNSLLYGALGQGSSPHLLMELGGLLTGVEFELVSYKGEVQGLQDLLGGNLPAFAGAMSNQLPHHQSGRLRIIGVSSDARLPDLPDVPTFKEAGFPDLAVSYWHGVLAPKGTPQAVIDELNMAIAAGMQTPAVKARLSIDQRVMTSSPEQFRELIVSDATKWGDLIRSRGIKVE